MVGSRKRKNVSTVATPPPPPLLCSDGPPNCSDYGRYRKEVWKGQGFNFCNECDKYDEARSAETSNKKIKRNGQRFQCKAKHTSFAHPTTRLPNVALWFKPLIVTWPQLGVGVQRAAEQRSTSFLAIVARSLTKSLSRKTNICVQDTAKTITLTTMNGSAITDRLRTIEIWQTG